MQNILDLEHGLSSIRKETSASRSMTTLDPIVSDELREHQELRSFYVVEPRRINAEQGIVQEGPLEFHRSPLLFPRP